jgi:hypothetical protein
MGLKPVFLRGFLVVFAVSLLLGSSWAVNLLPQEASAAFETDPSASALPLVQNAAFQPAEGYQLEAESSTYIPLLMQQSPIPKNIFGIEMHSLTDRERVDLVASKGTSWVRRNGLLWTRVETAEGVYNWTDSYTVRLENDLLTARQQGLEIILVIRSTPTWARYPEYADIPCGPIRPDKYEAFANFMVEVVKRYSGHPYYVTYYQLGNEPEAGVNHVPPDTAYGCWGIEGAPYFNGGAYGEMLSVVYPRIKEARPGTQVVFGGLLLDCHPALAPADKCNGEPLQFLEGALDRNGNKDGKNYFDILAFHGYDYFYIDDENINVGWYGHPGWGSDWRSKGPVLLQKAEFLKTVLNQFGAGDKPIMNSEGGLICTAAPHLCEVPEWEITKAYYLPQYFAAAKSLGLTSGMWYSTLGWRGSGLLDSTGTPTQAYTTYEVAVQRLADLAFQKRVDTYSGVFAYEFANKDRTTWFLWSQDGASRTITLPSQPKQIWDVFGNPIPVNGSQVEVTIKPIYIEW